MSSTTLRFLVLFVLVVAGCGLAGCPSVAPGSLDPAWLDGNVGFQLIASSHFSGTARGAPLELQERVRAEFQEGMVRAYSLHEQGQALTAVKTVLSHPGLLQQLEINRYLSAFVQGCAEDQWLTFFREDDLVRSEAFRTGTQRELRARGTMTVSLENQAFNIYEDVTPRIYTFRKPAIRVPLSQVELGFKDEANRVIVRIRDENLVAELRKKVGWPEDDDPSFASAESFAEKISLERKLFAVVAGIVIIEDVVRPGAQVVIDDRGPGWVFGGFLRDREKAWVKALFARDEGRRVERYVLQIRRTEPQDLLREEDSELPEGEE